MKKTYKASRVLNRILKITLGNYLKSAFNIVFMDENGVGELAPPYILIANHTNFWDPFLLSIFIKEPIYFVTSDYFFRKPVLKFLLKLVGAIPKTKSMSDMETVKSIIRVRNENRIIGIFPEGRRSWDGKTLGLVYSTAKLVKTLKIPVVAALMRGAYLSLPRWAKKGRKGKITLSYRKVIDTGEIAGMTVEEIFTHLKNSIDHDECAWQEQNMIPFNGKTLAEELELFLFLCPGCKSIGTLKSHKNRLYCRSCGYTVRYDEYGYFRDVPDGPKPLVRLQTPKEWGAWQRKCLEKILAERIHEFSGEPLFEDRGVIMKTGSRCNPLKKLHLGRMALFRDRIEYTTLAGKTYVFRIEGMSGVNVQSRQIFEFYYEKVLYLFSFKIRHTSAHKWVETVEVLSEVSGSARRNAAKATGNREAGP